MVATSGLRDFLEIPYDQLEEMNLEAKEARHRPRPTRRRSASSGCKYLTDEKRIKAVTVCFTDLEGRLHMLDYDKKFLLKSADNLTFDGSSIRGFSQQHGVRPAAGDRLAGVLLAARPTSSAPARCWCSARCCERDGTPYRGRHARACSRRYADELYDARTAPSATPPTRSRASCSRAATPSAATTRPASSSSSPPAATTTRCPATRCAASSTPRPKCSARWASRTRRTTPRWRRRSSR